MVDKKRVTFFSYDIGFAVSAEEIADTPIVQFYGFEPMIVLEDELPSGLVAFNLETGEWIQYADSGTNILRKGRLRFLGCEITESDHKPGDPE